MTNTYRFSDVVTDDTGSQVNLYRNGCFLCSGVALHNGNGPESTIIRAAMNARFRVKGFRYQNASLARQGAVATDSDLTADSVCPRLEHQPEWKACVAAFGR